MPRAPRRSMRADGERLSELDGQAAARSRAGRRRRARGAFRRWPKQAEDDRPLRRGGRALPALPRARSRPTPSPPSTAPTACAAPARRDEAAHAYARAIKLDPSFVEAWFNLAGLLRERGQIEAARRHLRKAIALDADYADAVYNLATLEFDAGNLAEARRWWVRYLELDSDVEWARTRRARHPLRRPAADAASTAG